LTNFKIPDNCVQYVNELITISEYPFIKSKIDITRNVIALKERGSHIRYEKHNDNEQLSIIIFITTCFSNDIYSGVSIEIQEIETNGEEDFIIEIYSDWRKSLEYR